MSNFILPYQLNKVIFGKVHLERQPEMANNTEFGIHVELKTIDEKLPKNLEIHLQVNSIEDQPLLIDLLLIGQFGLTQEDSAPSEQEISNFVSNYAIHFLWVYMNQMVKSLTAQMGINTIALKHPSNFKFKPDSEQSV